MNYHLVCVHEFGSYKRGDVITDADEIAKLMTDRDHHFVKIAAPEPAEMPKVAPMARSTPVSDLG